MGPSAFLDDPGERVGTSRLSGHAYRAAQGSSGDEIPEPPPALHWHRVHRLKVRRASALIFEIYCSAKALAETESAATTFAGAR